MHFVLTKGAFCFQKCKHGNNKDCKQPILFLKIEMKLSLFCEMVLPWHNGLHPTFCLLELGPCYIFVSAHWTVLFCISCCYPVGKGQTITSGNGNREENGWKIKCFPASSFPLFSILRHTHPSLSPKDGVQTQPI